MFHVDGAGHEHILGGDYRSDLEDDLQDNMEFYPLSWQWYELEPGDGEYDWGGLDDWMRDNRDKHRVIRTGPHFIPDGGGDFLLDTDHDIPWLDARYSNPEFKERYGGLLRETVIRYGDDVDLWWVGEEVNLGGDGLSWEQQKDWLKWQTHLIKGADPDAVIAVSFGSWADYHEQMPTNAIGEVEGAMELEAEGVDYDVIAIEYHYGTLQEGGIGELGHSISELEQAGKDIFIWEIFFPSETDPDHRESWDWFFPPDSGYNGGWQADQLARALELAFENPRIIGMNILHFQDITYDDIDPEEWEAGWRCHAGLVGPEGSPKESYEAIKGYWESVRDD